MPKYLSHCNFHESVQISHALTPSTLNDLQLSLTISLSLQLITQKKL